METILQVLMRRDKMSKESAMDLILEARDQLQEYLELGDEESVYNICQEYFNLKPDYLIELIYLHLCLLRVDIATTMKQSQMNLLYSLEK